MSLLVVLVVERMKAVAVVPAVIALILLFLLHLQQATPLRLVVVAAALSIPEEEGTDPTLFFWP